MLNSLTIYAVRKTTSLPKTLRTLSLILTVFTPGFISLHSGTRIRYNPYKCIKWNKLLKWLVVKN